MPLPGIFKNKFSTKLTSPVDIYTSFLIPIKQKSRWVAQRSSEVSISDAVNRCTYGYAQGLGDYNNFIRARKNNDIRNVNVKHYQTAVNNFEQGVDTMISLRGQIANWVVGTISATTAIILAAFVAVQFIPVVNAFADFLTTLLGGGVGFSAAMSLANMIINYVGASREADSALNQL